MKELMIFLDQNTRNKSKSKFSPVLFINNVQPTTLPALVVTISSDFGGSSRFGAFPQSHARETKPPDERLFQSKHFIVYSSIYLANKLFTAQKCLTFIIK